MPFFLHDAVYLSITTYLDAVYLYLLSVNQTLAEGYTDFRDGRLIRTKAIGQRFVGRPRLSAVTVLIDCSKIFGVEELRVWQLFCSNGLTVNVHFSALSVNPAPSHNLQTSFDGVNLTIRYDTRCYFNVRSKADISQLNLPHGTDN